MKAQLRRWPVVILLTSALTFPTATFSNNAGGIQGASDPPSTFHEKRVNIGFYSEIPSDILARIDTEGGTVLDMRPEILLVVATNKTTVSRDAFIARMRTYADVEYAVADLYGKLTYTPNDPLYQDNSQWGPQKIGAPAAWNLSFGNDAIVANIDTGIFCLHEDFRRGDAGGVPVTACTTDSMLVDSAEGHGTMTAGVIAATISNNKGVAGLSRAKITALPANDPGGTHPLVSQTAISIILASLKPPKIISLQVTFDCRLVAEACIALQRAVEYADGAGRLIISSAGNLDCEYVGWPAAYPQVVAVGSTDRNDLISVGETGCGPELDIVAPGKDIWTTCAPASLYCPSANQYYRSASGASFATPHVTGVAALLWSYRPCLAKAQVISLILDNTVVLDGYSSSEQGRGRLTADRPLQAAPTC